MEANEYYGIWRVMLFQVKDARLCCNQLIASLESDGNADRIWFRRSVTCLNNKYFAVYGQRRHSVVTSFCSARECEPNFANSCKAVTLVTCHMSLATLVISSLRLRALAKQKRRVPANRS